MASKLDRAAAVLRTFGLSPADAVRASEELFVIYRTKAITVGRKRNPEERRVDYQRFLLKYFTPDAGILGVSLEEVLATVLAKDADPKAQFCIVRPSEPRVVLAQGLSSSRIDGGDGIAVVIDLRDALRVLTREPTASNTGTN